MNTFHMVNVYGNIFTVFAYFFTSTVVYGWYKLLVENRKKSTATQSTIILGGLASQQLGFTFVICFLIVIILSMVIKVKDKE